jgi:hypothetical protein
MKTPFTVEQFLSVFQQYNNSVWPMQVFFYMLGVCAIVLIFYRNKVSNRLISGMLAFLWLWTGIVYHLGFFSSINKAAYAFGAAFIIQGIIFLVAGVVRSGLSFRVRSDVYGILGFIFLVYALVIYPILGSYLGHRYPSSPTFGLPCPTVIFTFGILLFTEKKVSFLVLLIPLLWSILGFSASFTFGIYEDLGLLAAGLTGTGALLIRNRRNLVVTNSE